jgi:hypothetical protein
VIKFIIIILGISQVLDVYFTSVLLQRGYIELNPIAEFIINNYGYLSLLALKLSIVVFLYEFSLHIKSKFTYIVLFSAVSTYIALNFYQVGETIL